jgi:hypothetical protein
MQHSACQMHGMWKFISLGRLGQASQRDNGAFDSERALV